jgi:hypothetical protein
MILKILLAISCLVVAFILLFRMNVAKPVGGIDEGRLFLAGATSLMQGKGYPITQRTPLYSLFLASIGYVAGVDPDQTIEGAHEYGSIENVDVATGFLQPRFQRFVLFAQLLIWIATVFFVYKIGQIVNLPLNWLLILLIAFVSTSWILVTYIYDPVLTQFFLVLGTYALCIWLKNPTTIRWILLSGVSFSISALIRPTFQILTPLLALTIWILTRKTNGLKFAGIFLITWLLFVGTYSFRNYVNHGFFGVSCATGLSLSGRAATFIEKARPLYPTEVDEFLKIREIRGNTLGARSIKWLMSNRGMTWPQANNFLVKVCTAAIIRAPMRYLVEVGKSLVTFHMPGSLKGDRGMLLPFYFADALFTGIFLICTMMWISYHLMRLLTAAVNGTWSIDDSLILVFCIIYWYCAFISCGVDYGRPEHRISVLYLIPLTSLLILRRLEFPKRFHK